MERGLRKSQVTLEVGEGQGDGFLRSAKDHPPERTGDLSVAEDRRQSEHRDDTTADARQTEQVERDSGDGGHLASRYYPGDIAKTNCVRIARHANREEVFDLLRRRWRWQGE